MFRVLPSKSGGVLVTHHTVSIKYSFIQVCPYFVSLSLPIMYEPTYEFYTQHIYISNIYHGCCSTNFQLVESRKDFLLHESDVKLSVIHFFFIITLYLYIKKNYQ